MIDLRSDTVTKPTPAMRKAMAEAEVGDDVFGEDPTVRQLQDEVADLLGKEAALFVPSGVMGNQIGLKVHTRPGDEVIVERHYHLFNYESGAPGLISGVQLHVIDAPRGLLTPDHVEAAIRPGYYWESPSRLVWLENTINKAGGVVYPLDSLRLVADCARAHDLRLHLDGARLWNASAASGVAEADYAALFDTVNVCLSKGLGAPVGSVLAGPADLIQEAHRIRKLLGGGMRQAGILAAAALHALRHHRDALRRDHELARRLAEGLAELPAFAIDPEATETNIVLFDVVDGPAAPVLETLRDEGVLMVPFGPSTIRATTHRDVTADQIDRALAVFQRHFGRPVAAA